MASENALYPIIVAQPCGKAVSGAQRAALGCIGRAKSVAMEKLAVPSARLGLAALAAMASLPFPGDTAYDADAIVSCRVACRNPWPGGRRRKCARAGHT